MMVMVVGEGDVAQDHVERLGAGLASVHAGLVVVVAGEGRPGVGHPRCGPQPTRGQRPPGLLQLPSPLGRLHGRGQRDRPLLAFVFAFAFAFLLADFFGGRGGEAPLAPAAERHRPRAVQAVVIVIAFAFALAFVFALSFALVFAFAFAPELVLVAAGRLRWCALVPLDRLEALRVQHPQLVLSPTLATMGVSPCRVSCGVCGVCAVCVQCVSCRVVYRSSLISSSKMLRLTKCAWDWVRWDDVFRIISSVVPPTALSIFAV